MHFGEFTSKIACLPLSITFQFYNQKNVQGFALLSKDFKSYMNLILFLFLKCIWSFKDSHLKVYETGKILGEVIA